MDNRWWLWYRDKYIDEYIENNKNYSVNTLIKYLKNLKIDTQCIDEQIKLFWEKISRADEQCDVKIKDFIAKNFCKKQLFIDIEHPHFVLFKEYAKQICSILGIKCKIFLEKYCAIYGHSIVVYPQVKKYLTLELLKEINKINPEAEVEIYKEFFMPESKELFDNSLVVLTQLSRLSKSSIFLY